MQAAAATFAPLRRRRRAWPATAFWPTGAAAAVMLWCQPGQAQDVQAGRAIATRWCATCHVVQPGQARATSTGAPSFAAIAKQKALTSDGLRAFLQTGHGRMPDLHLSRQEINDLTAFIMSQRTTSG
ncbi:MAG TPA: c-type cytochrome [Rhodopila sp.]|nr:c-type cytochrome [Rhodopila sp.]